MKKTNITITMLCLAAACACGDTKITWLADVTADRAETVTGVQSGQVAAAAAHILRTDNPHGVTAAQIGALTAEQDLAALRTYHYGSPDIIESPAEWFVFDGAGTITAFNWAAGRENVVIPWEIGGVPVTAIGRDAFRASAVVSLIAPQTVISIEGLVFNNCPSLASVSLPQAQTIGGFAFANCDSLASVSLPQAQTVGGSVFYGCDSLTSVSLPQVQTVGDVAFANCPSLASVSLPQAQTVGDNAFNSCSSLTSVSLPQVQTVGDVAFANCDSLASVSLPQVQTIGDYAFYACYLLTSLYFDNDAPAIGSDTFHSITANQVTNYVTNPHATGWGTTFSDMPVVRPPLYADAFTLNGDTITEWPEGGGETSIIAPLYESGTNITVTSTQSVYSVAVTGAGPVGIDWSGLALDGTGRAEVTLRINVTDWAGTNVTFSPSLTFDRTPEILVTGVWEFAASTIDGVTTRVRQTWPLTDEWTTATYAYASGGWVSSLQRMNVGEMSTNSLTCVCPSAAPLLLIRPHMYTNANKPVSFSYGLSMSGTPSTSVPTTLYGPFSVGNRYVVSATHAVENPSGYGLVQIWVGNSSPDSVAMVLVYPDRTHIRPANANERAAYEAGWRP